MAIGHIYDSDGNFICTTWYKSEDDGIRKLFDEYGNMIDYSSQKKEKESEYVDRYYYEIIWRQK